MRSTLITSTFTPFVSRGVSGVAVLRPIVGKWLIVEGVTKRVLDLQKFNEYRAKPEGSGRLSKGPV